MCVDTACRSILLITSVVLINAWKPGRDKVLEWSLLSVEPIQLLAGNRLVLTGFKDACVVAVAAANKRVEALVWLTRLAI